MARFACHTEITESTERGHHRWRYIGHTDTTDRTDIRPSQMAGVWGRLKARNYKKIIFKIIQNIWEPSQMAIYRSHRYHGNHRYLSRGRLLSFVNGPALRWIIVL